MKTIYRYWVFIFLYYLLFTQIAFAEKNNTLNIYNWANYMPKEIITQFEKETGIRVSYSTYDGNDVLYAKLKADPTAGYDVIVPSSYFIERMRTQHMIQKLDKSRLPNMKYINPALLNKDFDPGNQYSLPYFWGSTGIVVNKKYINPRTITRWSDLWHPKFYNKLLILNDPHDVFSMALMMTGYPANDTNVTHIEKAYENLKKLLPNIKLFNSDAAKVNYIDEDVIIGMGYSGDTYQAYKENPNLVYIYPQEGFVVWIDSMAIPAHAPHLHNAYLFLNFIMRPDISAKLSLALAYATPNLEALKLLPENIKNNPIIYPDAKILSRGQFEAGPGELDRVYEKYMEALKISA